MLATLDMIQDAFSGRVRAEFYNEFQEERPRDTSYDDVCVPFAVMVFHDGYQPDLDEWDNYPNWIAHSYHATQRSAEIEIAWMKFNGCEAITEIQKNYWTYEADLIYMPIRG